MPRPRSHSAALAVLAMAAKTTAASRNIVNRRDVNRLLSKHSVFTIISSFITLKFIGIGDILIVISPSISQPDVATTTNAVTLLELVGLGDEGTA